MYVFWSNYFSPNKQIGCKLYRTVTEFVEKPTDYAPMNLCLRIKCYTLI